MITFYPEGNNVLASDNELRSLHKIADNGAGGGPGGSGSVTCGVADPVAAPSVACALHYRTDNGGLWMWNGATWIPLIVA